MEATMIHDQARSHLLKTDPGRFLEDFALGEMIRHATPRTLTTGDAALYGALYGARFAVQSSDAFARAISWPASPLDDLLIFHTVFGKTVPDISINAVANLGYADVRFLKPVMPGTTLSANSEVIGLKENSDGATGVVYVRTRGQDENGDCVLTYVRWVMVRKRTQGGPPISAHIPDLPTSIPASELASSCPKLSLDGWDNALSGSPYRFADYNTGERIDHVDGATVEEAEHQLATRLYQNNAKVHFDAHAAKDSRFGKRLVYGGHVISIARALSFNGIANAVKIAAINGGRHVAPIFAGDTVYAWSQVLETAELPGRSDLGALRLRLIATKNQPCTHFPDKNESGAYDPAIVLDLDYWALMPR
jgi:2-methylfumaryl-CoA hydratase